MVVQHNLTAMNSNRMLGMTQSAQAKSSEKLSSGYRINRAADDAAGLTISEKMRKQINGLDRASTNAEDGVSAVQTAEGALTEVHSMLQRMNELAVQAANGTNSEDDRAAIQAEIEQLTTEIDRVAETTKFNETYLLKGNAEGESTTMKVAAHDAGLAGKLTDNGDGTVTFAAEALETGDKVKIAGKEYSIVDSANKDDYKALTGLTAAAGDVLEKDGVTYTYVAKDDTTPAGQTADAAGWFASTNDTTTADTGITIAAGDKFNGKIVVDAAADANIGTVADVQDEITGLSDGDTVTIDGVAYTVGITTDTTTNDRTADDIAAMVKEGTTVDVNGTEWYALPADSQDDSEITVNEAYDMMANELKTASSIGTDTAAEVANNGDGTFTITQGSVEVKKALDFNLHVGADADMTNKIGVTIEAMSTAGLGIKGLDVTDTTGANATYAIDAIADAIAKVSSQRSSLGAIQNRLEHTIANLDNVVENTTAAESRIRDTDMAEEMVEYSKNNILAQAGQSMLAQANQSTQGVLSLLG